MMSWWFTMLILVANREGSQLHWETLHIHMERPVMCIAARNSLTTQWPLATTNRVIKWIVVMTIWDFCVETLRGINFHCFELMLQLSLGLTFGSNFALQTLWSCFDVAMQPPDITFVLCVVYIKWCMILNCGVTCKTNYHKFSLLAWKRPDNGSWNAENYYFETQSANNYDYNDCCHGSLRNSVIWY